MVAPFIRKGPPSHAVPHDRIGRGTIEKLWVEIGGLIVFVVNFLLLLFTCIFLSVIMAIGDPSGSVELINNLDAGNPLFLQSNDNSSLSIVNVKLVGAKNYKMWATTMKIDLKGKNKMRFIDGTYVKQ
ncbi:ribonuclease H-like domain-containing protein [Tanacetum coccineum]